VSPQRESPLEDRALTRATRDLSRKRERLEPAETTSHHNAALRRVRACALRTEEAACATFAYLTASHLAALAAFVSPAYTVM